jgi:hypothetical protein
MPDMVTRAASVSLAAYRIALVLLYWTTFFVRMGWHALVDLDEPLWFVRRKPEHCVIPSREA